MRVGKSHDVSWGNWLKPTPRNVLRISTAIQDALIGASTISVFTELNKWIPIGLSLSILLVRGAVKFFASVVEDEATESAVAEFPSGEQVVITKEAPIDPRQP